MAFDGITLSALEAEIDDNLKGGRINKIAQQQNDQQVRPEDAVRRIDPSVHFHRQNLGKDNDLYRRRP